MSEARVEQLQQRLERQRQALDGTLTAIERRLSFEELANSPLQYMRDSLLGEYGGSLRDAVTHNPIPMTLLGVSLTWLMMGGQRASARVGDTLQQKAAAAGERLESGAAVVRDKVKAGAESLRERAADTAANLQGKAQETADRVRSKGESMAEESGGRLHQLRVGSADYGRRALQEHPLALSFLGLAVGAAIAALLPETRMEQQTMGEARDRLAEEATSTGERLMEGAKSAMHAGTKAATEEAQRQAGTGKP